MAVTTSLTSLNLVNNIGYGNREEGPAFARAIAEGLAASALLTELNLSNNWLSGFWNDGLGRKVGTYNAEGINTIASALDINASLTSLDLQFNNLNADAKAAIISANEKRPTKLQSLQL